MKLSSSLQNNLYFLSCSARFVPYGWVTWLPVCHASRLTQNTWGYTGESCLSTNTESEIGCRKRGKQYQKYQKLSLMLPKRLPGHWQNGCLASAIARSLHRASIAGGWRSWWVWLICGGKRSKRKARGRTSALIVCKILQVKGMDYKTLRWMKYPLWVFFFPILSFEWDPIRAGAEWTAQTTITLKNELVFGSAFRNVGQSLMYRRWSFMLSNVYMMNSLTLMLTASILWSGKLLHQSHEHGEKQNSILKELWK